MRACIIFGLTGLMLGTSACGESVPPGDPPTSATRESGGPTARSGERPSILLVVWDTVRADHLGCYGYQRPTTPFLDRLVRGARQFENVTSSSCWTAPSHATMFTGWPALVHGAIGQNPFLSEDFSTLAELLGDAGYDTFMFTSNPFVSEHFRMAQGFQHVACSWEPPYAAIVDDLGRRRGMGSSLTSEQWVRHKDAGTVGVEALFRWLDERDSEAPFFAYVGLMEAHWPWFPTREELTPFLDEAQIERWFELDLGLDSLMEYTFGWDHYDEADLEVMRGLYDACIRRLDGITAMLFQRLQDEGLLHDMVVVVTADHGDSLGDHHMIGHNFALYRNLVRVPLMLWAPGVAPGRSSAPVHLADLFPTVLGVAGIDDAPMPPGLIDLLQPEPRGERTMVAEFLEPKTMLVDKMARRHPDLDLGPWLRPLTSLQKGDTKLISRGDEQFELYDLAADPDETNDLAAREPEQVMRLRQELVQWRERMRRVGPLVTPGEGVIDPEMQLRLQQLGYGADDGGRDR